MKYCLNYCSLWYSSTGDAYTNLRWSDDLIVSSKFKIQISLHINQPSATSSLSCWLRKLNNFYASTYSTTENFEVIFFKFPNCQFTESKACFSYQRHIYYNCLDMVQHRARTPPKCSFQVQRYLILKFLVSAIRCFEKPSTGLWK